MSDKRLFSCRVDTSTPDIIDDLALQFGCKRITGDGKLIGSTGVLLDKIAQGELLVIPAL